MTTDFWKRKLAAYLHDPPSKALDIRTHGDRSDAAFAQAGFSDTEVGAYFAHADHTAAAMDRLPFPKSSAGLQCVFDGVRNGFLHPLSGGKLPFHAEFKSAEQVFAIESAVQPALSPETITRLPDDNARWRAKFFAHWRLWPKHAMENDYRMALLPADTRIPDHSIWTHMQVVSALDGCVGENKVFQPAFLKFQLGPVQDFIAAARSIRDLWSGSYLLSWLMAAGLKALSAEVGPDAVIFPNLRGQPLFDLHWRNEIWNVINISDQRSVWESLGWKNDALLTPNLPNVFLAVVSEDRAADLGRKVSDAVQAEWKRIADAVWNECEKARLTDDEGGITAADRKVRFDSQIVRFLSVSWQVTPWPAKLEDALKLADDFENPQNAGDEVPIQKARHRVQAVVDMAEKHMPKEERDIRYFECERFPEGHSKAGRKDRSKLKDDAKLDNVGLGWSVILALNSWQLDAVRQTRHFDAANTGGWQTGTFHNKDVLTGRDEAVAGGERWFESCQSLGKPWTWRFKHADWLGAVTLIKRLWDTAYLKPVWDLDVQKMPNTRGLAAHDPFAKDEKFNDDERSDDAENLPPSEKYFAVLAFDGDEIGKWVSGEKTPPFSSQLAHYKDGLNIQRFGAKPYFEKPGFKGFLKAQRPLSPSYHLQFGEALSNFALFCARPIVEAFLGRLIYAGGDDVVALLPADTALACSEALRAAFTGREVKAPDGSVLFHSPSPGFLSSDDRKDDHGRGRPIPFLVPGPAADASVGIAIAHFKSPLQDVVRAAQAAEKRAKKQLGRSAVAVALFKRSGETIEWGCNWESRGLEAFDAMLAGISGGIVSAKFPHRIVELVEGYKTDASGKLGGTKSADGFDAVARKILAREIATATERQRGSSYSRDGAETIRDAILAYLDSPSLDAAEAKVNALIDLCQTVAFIERNLPKGH